MVLGKNYTNAYKTSDFGLINYKYPQKPNKKKMEKNGQNIYKAKKKNNKRPNVKFLSFQRSKRADWIESFKQKILHNKTFELLFNMIINVMIFWAGQKQEVFKNKNQKFIAFFAQN